MDEYDEAASGLDLDALQAQINMAMAETEELVSSWVQPSKNLSQRPKRSIEEVEKELKEYLRRPPRLGVGAPIPEPVGPSAQEKVKLKNKLVGNDKKRRREDDTATNNPGDDIDEEEEETRKGESSTKIARVDPFSLPKKKKAKHKAPVNAAQGQANGTISPHPATNEVLTATPRELSEMAVQETTHRRHELSPTIDNPAVSLHTILFTNGIRSPSSSSHGSSVRPERSNPFTLPDKSDTEELNMFSSSHISPLHASAPSTHIGTTTSASSSASNLGGSTQQQLPTPAPSQDTPSPSTTTMPAKKKKKKKKKRKAGLDHVSANLEVVNSVTDSFDSPSRTSQSGGKPEDAKAGSNLPMKTLTADGTSSKEPDGTNHAEDEDSNEYDDADLTHSERRHQSAISKGKPNGIDFSPNSKDKRASSSLRPEHPRRPPTSLPGPSIGHLLNLTGPPESVADTDDDKDETPSVSPSKKDKKKKRKRHKKKKKKKKHNLTTNAANE